MRLWVLCIAGLTIFVGLAAATNHEVLPERDNQCWDCHKDWVPTPIPLGSFWNIVPPEPTAVPANEPLAWTITVQNGWYHEVRYLEPVLDLSNAPSLKFFDGRENFVKNLTGTVARHVPIVEPPEPPQIIPNTSGLTAESRGEQIIDIPVGATGLKLTLAQVDDSFGPEIQWNIFTKIGGDEPIFGPLYTVGDETATVELTRQADFQGKGYGNWTVEAIISPTDRNGDPNLFGSQLPFKVTQDVRFDAGDLTTSLLSQSLRLEPFQTTLFSWELQATGAPQPGEEVLLTVNGTAYYKHNPNSSNLDWQNVTKSVRIPVTGEVQPVLDPDISLFVIVVPEANVGPTLVTISEAIGYASAFLIVSSTVTGGMFGKASRRSLNNLFGSAKRRVAFHNFLSYGLTAAALAHTALFLYTNIVDGTYYWTAGLIWGSIAILAMFSLGVTGALQVAMIRRWNYSTWRWVHFGLAIGAIVFTVAHLMLDGAHFGTVQEWLGYHDPLDFRQGAPS